MKNIQLVQTNRSLTDHTFRTSSDRASTDHTLRSLTHRAFRSLTDRTFFVVMSALVISGVVKLENLPE